MVTEELTFKCFFISKRPGVKKKRELGFSRFPLSQSEWKLQSPFSSQDNNENSSKMFDNRPIALYY